MKCNFSEDCVAMQPPETVLLKAPRTSLSARLSDKSVPVTAQRFQFSKVYGPDTTQKEIFDGTVKSLVQHVLEGQNCLVFTYGVTNAGKTFTFLGFLPRSLNMIFGSLEGRIFNQMCLKPQRCRDFIRLTKKTGK
ncbi:kinesin-like protein KIF20B isoform X2 [Misgurnus anguillicaudatus]|uniref:kinesin-like protein KIF20B isoform X2 n=1 Tax=Misgurnus anguillicaudatus TaxID=75329 RepID=UPI003CCF36F3